MRFFRIPAAAVLLVFMLQVVQAAEIVTVEATGSGMTESAALDDALRKAVEKGGGVEVAARTETLDHAVAFDRIVTRAKGFVSGYEVKETRKKWDLWAITIVARVDKGAIGTAWGETRLLLERKGQPTVMVLVRETVFDKKGKAQDAMTEYAASAIEQILLSRGFKLKSFRGLQEIEARQKDAAIAKNDVDSLAAIARRFGANVMIVGDSTCRFGGAVKAHGVDLFHYQATASVKAYNSDTADTLLSLTMEGKGSGMGETEAIGSAFRKLGERLSETVLKNLLEKWYFEFQHGSTFSIELEALAQSADQLGQAGKMAIRFQEVLKEIEGVKDVRMNNFDKGSEKAVATYSIETTLALEDLRNRMMTLETEEAGFTIEWTGGDKNSLRFNMRLK